MANKSNTIFIDSTTGFTSNSVFKPYSYHPIFSCSPNHGALWLALHYHCGLCHFSFPLKFLLLPMTSNHMTDLISHGFRCGSSTSTKFLNTSGRRIPMFPQSSEASLVSMDWEKGNILTGNHRFSQEI